MAPELFDHKSLSNIDYLAVDIPRSFFQYEASPNALFPRGPLNNFNVSSDGQSFICALMKPKPQERLNSDAAMCHAWVHSSMPNAPMIPADRGESSASSSGRSSFEDEVHAPNGYSAAWTTVQLNAVPRDQLNEVQELQPLPKAEIEGDLPLEKPDWREVKQGLKEEMSLLTAAHLGGDAQVKLLLENGADIEVKDSIGRAALTRVVQHKAVVKLLLENGADIEVKDSIGRAALTRVVQHKAVVKLLLKYGADLETKSHGSETPLHLAAIDGEKAMVKLLLEQDANLEAKDKYSMTPRRAGKTEPQS